MKMKFVVALFGAIKADPELNDMTCFIDSNGHLGDLAWSRVLPVTDGVMLDVKAFDAKTHAALTGRDNDKSLASARTVFRAGKLFELRFLMVAGHTDSDWEISRLIAFVGSLDLDLRVRLNAFQLHGVRGGAKSWPRMDREGLERAASRLRLAGIVNVVTPVVWI